MHLSFNDELLSFELTKEEDSVQLICTRHRFNPGNDDLGTVYFFESLPSARAVLNLPGLGASTVRCARVVNEASTDLMRPSVVVGPPSSISNRQECVFFIVMVAGDALKVVRKLKVHPSPDQQIVLLDGPNVCILDRHVMKFTHNQIRHNYQVVQAVSVYGNDDQTKFDVVSGALKYDLVSAVLKDETLIALVKTSSESEPMDTGENVGDEPLSLHALHYELKSGIWTDQFIKSSWYIPNIYEPVISCVHIIHIKPKRNKDEPNGNRFSNKILLGTSLGQLILFRDGQLCDCVTLPSPDLVQIVHWSCHGSHESAAVLTEKANVYIISLETFKVTESFSSVAGMFLGDFLHRGSDQLLLTHISDEDNLSQIIITDGLVTWVNTFNQSGVGDGATAVEHGDENNNMTTSAINALQSRLQSGLHQLWEAERDACMREKVAMETFQALQRMSLNGVPSTVISKVGLVGLLGSTPSSSDQVGEGDATSVEDTKVREVTPPIHVIDRWQRLIGEDWIIGVNIANKSDVTIYDVNLLLVPEDGFSSEMESTSFLVTVDTCTSSSTGTVIKKRKLDTADSDLAFGQSAGKKSVADEQPPVSVRFISNLGHGEMACVATVTKLPSFCRSKKRHIELILQWRMKDSEAAQRSMKMQKVEVAGRKKSEKVDVAACLLPAGSINLSSDDVLHGAHQLSVQHEHSMNDLDLISLSVWQFPVALTLTSLLSSLQMLPEKLQKAGFTYVSRLAQWMQRNAGPLHLVRVNIQQVERNKADIVLHVRDDKQLYLVLHALYGVLPDDVIIKPCCHDNKRENMEQAVHALDDEISYLNSSCREMITSSETVGNMVPEPEVSAIESKSTKLKEMERARTEFKRRQLLIKENNRGYVPSSAVGKLRRELTQKQLQTNACIQQLTDGNGAS